MSLSCFANSGYERFEKLARVSFVGSAEKKKLDNVHAPFPGFAFGDEGLRVPEAFCCLRLSQSGLRSGFAEQCQEGVVFR